MHHHLRLLSNAALLIGACATPAASPPADHGRVVRVQMTDLAFTPPQIILNAGETVTIVLTNVGKLEHEFMAGTGAMAGKGYSYDWLAEAKPSRSGSHDMGHVGEGVRVAPGTSATIAFTVPARGGQFEFGCFVEGHYEGGMRGVLVVSGTTVPTSSAPGATSVPSATHDMEGDGEAH